MPPPSAQRGEARHIGRQRVYAQEMEKGQVGFAGSLARGSTCSSGTGRSKRKALMFEPRLRLAPGGTPSRALLAAGAEAD